MKIAILDASVLMSLYSSKLLQHLHLFYELVLVPKKVELEFFESYPAQEERSSCFAFLVQHYQQYSSWLRPCNEYSSSSIEIYKTLPGIDDGEAEAFAQLQSWEQKPELLLDDQKARAFAKMNNWKHCGFLKLLAKMSLIYNLCDYQACCEKLCTGTRKAYFSKKIVRTVYSQVEEELKQGLL